ncbi:PLP-dependent aminotransferase family protein [Clostridium sp. CM028]|uniref:MocR-like pyridoxine biosynthesis transcription factor PdxR n=1 Tax=Clostridium TaxID=1485 RepID=UPI0013EE4404|nr:MULTISPECIES: PLP-dependent aminotransferase family protein [Clostridium]MBU3091874.1 PLP-dependent aminotransferase family protein [Clostridium sp. CF011]MBW9143961.1 PLP-dependent aminotransferase family protein [Clostridium sp. CM027]MBW9147723.1 PLP-dependent aminotransferase family protein [Clostridium sp. CM028]MBZ9608143.1 PLP-dependent aminotransferase family protein [Clostridium estertheticum]UVE41379.1 PLP-dependent aminotransferase family protein [Clostridium sp. CM027]
MHKYEIKFISEIPKYIEISKHIKKMIDENMVDDGEKLPSIRKLSKLLVVNDVTVVSAYKKLEAEGYAYQKMGSGTYAKRRDTNSKFKKEYSNTLKKISGQDLKKYIDFTGEITSSEYFPVTVFKDVLNEVLDRDGTEAFAYKESLGYEGLRNSISSFFWDNKVNTEDILILSGAQQGIDIVSKSIINVHDNVVVEKPTYGGALTVFKWRRANIFEVDMLEDGVNLLQFEEILKKNRIKCFYAMSYFQNPTGATYSLEKKLRILELAELYDFYIVEDDYLSELIYDQKQYKSFKSLDIFDRVIYIKSFSKIFLPGIRLGYMISPEKCKEHIQNSKINTDISTSSLMQRALDLYINKDLWKEHISRLNMAYKDKYNFMITCIEKNMGAKASCYTPGGGIHFYFKIATGLKINSMELFYLCKHRKVLITPGVLFYKNAKEGNDYFRLSFSEIRKPEIEEGINIISEILSGK